MVLFAAYDKNGNRLSKKIETDYTPKIDKLSEFLTEIVNKQKQESFIN